MSQKSHWKIRVSAWGGALFISVHLLAAQAQLDPKTHKFKLAQITFQGLTTMTQEKAITLSGLQIGQTVMLENLTAALQQMLNKGQISEGKYSYKYQGDNLDVTFIIKEARGSLPVYFDNFIWFTEAEIHEAIRQTLPNFSGKLTEGDEMATTVQQTLQKLLQEKKLAGRVENEMIGMGTAYIFRVADVPMPVCTVNFSGAQAFTETQLDEAIKEMYGTDYSRQVDRIIVRDRVIPLYRQHGYLKIKAPTVEGQPAVEEKCAKGAAQVSIKLDEGVIYKWNGVTFSGNQTISAERLARAFPLKANEIADGLKIDKAFMNAQKMYSEMGYFKASLPAQPTFDDAAQTVSFSITVSEGARFNLGQVFVKGLAQDITNQILTKWQEIQGKPYEDRMFAQFVSDAQQKANKRLPPAVNLTLEENSLTVDFVLDFQ